MVEHSAWGDNQLFFQLILIRVVLIQRHPTACGYSDLFSDATEKFSRNARNARTAAKKFSERANCRVGGRVTGGQLAGEWVPLMVAP